MTLSRMDRRRVDRLAELLDTTAQSPRGHRRLPGDDDIAPLLQMAHRLRALPPEPRPGPEFSSSLRTLLVAAAERDGVGISSVPPEIELESETTAWLAQRPLRSHSLSGRRQATRPVTGRGPGRARVAVLAGVAVGAIVLSGVSAASTGALPGDPLYGVKRSTEQAQLAFAGSDASRGKLYLEFARSRLSEAFQVRTDPRAVAGLLADMDAETVRGVAFMAGAAVAGDRTALDGLTGFATNQLTDLDGLAAVLPVTVRSQATTASRRLLQRIDDLVSSLGGALDRRCPVTGVDALGWPQPPRTC